MSNRRFQGRERGSKNFETWQKDILLEWLHENKGNMYPTEGEKTRIAHKLHSDKSKVSNWFINMRKRYFQHDLKVQINKYRYKPKLQKIKRMKRIESQFAYDFKSKRSIPNDVDLLFPELNKY